jgi:hypothetical protein
MSILLPQFALRSPPINYFLFRILIQHRTHIERSAKAPSSSVIFRPDEAMAGRAADPSDYQSACEERDIAMMRMITAACLLVLLVAPFSIRAADDFSCVKDSLSASHCFDGR